MTILRSAEDTVVADILHGIRFEQDMSIVLDEVEARYGFELTDLPSLDRATAMAGTAESKWQTNRAFGLLSDALDTDNVEIDSSPRPGQDAFVQQQPWTTVTKDHGLVNHLLKLYFTWQHAFFQNFPESLFRKDMAAGRTK